MDSGNSKPLVCYLLAGIFAVNSLLIATAFAQAPSDDGALYPRLLSTSHAPTTNSLATPSLDSGTYRAYAVSAAYPGETSTLTVTTDSSALPVDSRSVLDLGTADKITVTLDVAPINTFDGTSVDSPSRSCTRETEPHRGCAAQITGWYADFVLDVNAELEVCMANPPLFLPEEYGGDPCKPWNDLLAEATNSLTLDIYEGCGCDGDDVDPFLAQPMKPKAVRLDALALSKWLIKWHGYLSLPSVPDAAAIASDPRLEAIPGQVQAPIKWAEEDDARLSAEEKKKRQQLNTSINAATKELEALLRLEAGLIIGINPPKPAGNANFILPGPKPQIGPATDPQAGIDALKRIKGRVEALLKQLNEALKTPNVDNEKQLKKLIKSLEEFKTALDKAIADPNFSGAGLVAPGAIAAR